MRLAFSLPKKAPKTADFGPVGTDIFGDHQLGVSSRKYPAGHALGRSGDHVSKRGHPVL